MWVNRKPNKSTSNLNQLKSIETFKEELKFIHFSLKNNHPMSLVAEASLMFLYLQLSSEESYNNNRCF